MKISKLLTGLVIGALAWVALGQPAPQIFSLVSSNATVTFHTNINKLILDLSVATSGGATNGIQQLNGFGTNTTLNGATVHNGAHVDTNYVGYLLTTNGPWINVLAWGAKGDALTDDTAAISNATAYAVTSGYPVYFPGNHVYNMHKLIVDNNNIEWFGDGATENSPIGSELFALDSTLLQVGSDSQLIQGMRFRNLIFNGNGATGDPVVYVAGGSDFCRFDNCRWISGTRQVLVQGGTNFQTEFTYFANCFLKHTGAQANEVGLDVRFPPSGTKWTTATFVNNCRMAHGNTGHAIFLDSAALLGSDNYVDCVTNAAIQFEFTSTAATATRPYISWPNSTIDAVAHGVLLELGANSGNFLGDTVPGLGLDGTFVNQSGVTISNQSSAFVLPTFSLAYLPVIQEGFYMGHDANNMGVNSSSFTSWDGHNYKWQIWPTNANDLTPAYQWFGGSTNILMSILDRTNGFSFYPGNGTMTLWNDANSYWKFDNLAGTKGSFVQGDQSSGGDLIMRPYRDFRVAVNHFSTEVMRGYASGGLALGNLLGNPGTNQVRISGSTTFYDNAGTAMVQLLAAGDEVLTLNTNEHLKINAHDGTTLMVFYDAAGTAIEMRPTNGTVYIEHSTTPKLVLSDIAGNNAFQIFGDPVGGVGTVRAATNLFLEVNGGPTAVSLYHTGGEYFGPVPSDPGAFTYKFAGSVIATTNVTTPEISSPTAVAMTLSGTNVSVIGGLSADTVDATNGIKSAGTSYIGFGSGAINLTGRLAVTHITNVADLASTTAIAVTLSGTNVSAIGGLSAPIVTATNQLHLPYVTASKVLIANAQNDATNAVLTTGTIPVASTSGISDGPMQVGAVTNVAFNGGITADNVHATNGVTSGGFVFKQVSLTQGVSPLVDSTNQTLDFAQGMYQIWTLTNDVCLNAFSGSPSAATIKFRANGGNRNVLISTNWMPLNVQGGTANGSYYQFILTNGTQFSTLSAWATGANATNVAAVWANF